MLRPGWEPLSYCTDWCSAATDKGNLKHMASINTDPVQRQSPKSCEIAAMLNVAYSRHCDMTGIPAVRLSDCKRTNRPIFSIRCFWLTEKMWAGYDSHKTVAFIKFADLHASSTLWGTVFSVWLTIEGWEQQLHLPEASCNTEKYVLYIHSEANMHLYFSNNYQTLLYWNNHWHTCISKSVEQKNTQNHQSLLKVIFLCLVTRSIHTCTLYTCHEHIM